MGTLQKIKTLDTVYHFAISPSCSSANRRPVISYSS